MVISLHMHYFKSAICLHKAVDPGPTFLTFPTLPSTIASCLHLGGACPPHWVFQGFVAIGSVSGRNGRWGVVGPP